MLRQSSPRTLRRFAGLVALALVAAALVPPLAHSQMPCEEFQEYSCNSNCDTYWGWCVEGDQACINIYYYGCIETSPNQCCMIALQF